VTTPVALRVPGATASPVCRGADLDQVPAAAAGSERAWCGWRRRLVAPPRCTPYVASSGSPTSTASSSPDPAVYARLPKVHRDESTPRGLDRLELIRFLQLAQTISVHHGALAYLLGINALRATEAAAVQIEDYADTLRGHRVPHLVGKGNKPATMPLTVILLERHRSTIDSQGQLDVCQIRGRGLVTRSRSRLSRRRLTTSSTTAAGVSA
jgi:integrase